MAKVSMVERETKRAKTVAKFAAKRAELKAIISNVEASDEDRWERKQKLQNCRVMRARFVSEIAVRITGRPHGVYSKFGLCRNKLREAAMRGEVPGLVKASW